MINSGDIKLLTTSMYIIKKICTDHLCDRSARAAIACQKAIAAMSKNGEFALFLLINFQFVRVTENGENMKMK